MARVALITGGASGMGRRAVQAFADAGYAVAAADIFREGAAQSVAGLAGTHLACAADIADEAQVAALFETVERDLGPVAVLLNFAGIMVTPGVGQRPSIIGTELADWERTFAVNTRGTFLCLREMLRHRTRKPVAQARIINMSSSAAQLGGYNGSAAYIASKGAVLSLTKIAAREAAPLGLTVNCIAPGVIETPMLRSVMPPEADEAYCRNIPLARIGSPDDIAAAALFLASPQAGYITGSCIDVNGGIRMQ